jgi:hypothetical protein
LSVLCSIADQAYLQVWKSFMVFFCVEIFFGTGRNRAFVTYSRIHEHTISLRFLDVILRVLRLEVSTYNLYISNQFQTTFARGGGGGLKTVVEVTVNSKGEDCKDFCPNYVQEFGLRTFDIAG